MNDIVFMFDGQGAFRPGVGKELCNKYPKAKNVIEKAGEVLGYDLSDYLWGDKSFQTAGRTSLAQPAISAVSLAYAEVLRDYGLTASVSLGHSLGEMSAVLYSGAISFDDGIKTIKRRGELMEKAGKEGTMMAVINIDLKNLKEICKKICEEGLGPVVIANINAPNQVVISGSIRGIKRVAQYVTQAHGRPVLLNVGGAWHSPWLEDAANEFARFLDTIEFIPPSSKFYSVVELKEIADPGLIKESLKRQMLVQVNWVAAIKNLKAIGYEKFIEIGPSKILTGLAKKIIPDVKTASVASAMDLQTFATSL